MKKFRVTFLPDNKTVEVEQDRSVLSAAISAGIYLNSVCAGDGVCGRCKVLLKKGRLITQSSPAIDIEEKKNNVYLACLSTVHSDLEIEIPRASRLSLENLSPQEMEQRLRGVYSTCEDMPTVRPQHKEISFKLFPFVYKLYLELPRPSIGDSISDLDRLYRQLSKVDKPALIRTGLYNIRQLAELLRDADWKVTLTLARINEELEIVQIEPADSSKRNLGLAFDIGTTTISGQLIDLNSAKVLGTKAAYNRQAAFGSDVISRIIYASGTQGLERLHNAVSDTINRIILDLASENKADLNDLNSIVCAGNTTMMHLLLRIDPQNIRKDPYIPVANCLPVVRAQEASININPRGLLYCVPGVASYVGGDTTAGILSSGIYQGKDLNMLIDIGTNGEVALGNEEFLVACAASAGPAFEGSGLNCGMRAGKGAIEKVHIEKKDHRVKYSVIGGTKPLGICGCGYIELLASLLHAGIIDKNGKIVVDSAGVRSTERGKEFIVVSEESSASGSDIIISEADIDNLKRSKGAIYSAAAILVNHLGLDFSQVARIFIAGGFGTFLDIEKAVSIGLLPDLERRKFSFVGNSSLAGARHVLLSTEAMKTASKISRKVTYLELSTQAGYMDEYSQSLFFPHTQLGKFPTVKY